MILGTVGAVTGVLVGLHQAWPIVEPYALATRGFVIEFVGDVQKPIQQQLQSSNEILRDIQIEAFEGKLDSNKDAIAKWSLEKDKAADPNTKSMIDQHIKELTSSGERLKGQLDNLRMLKAKAH